MNEPNQVMLHNSRFVSINDTNPLEMGWKQNLDPIKVGRVLATPISGKGSC